MRGPQGLPVKPVPVQGWLARVLRRPDKAGAAARIWNLVATTPADRIGPDAVASILGAARARLADVHSDMRQLYTALLYQACRDDNLTDAEAANLRLLRRQLALTEREVSEISAAVYQGQLGSALKDENFSEEERARLKTLASQLRLPPDVANAAMKEEGGAVVQRLLDRAVSDRRLAPEEEAQLYALAGQLGITPKVDEGTAAMLTRLRLYWRIEQGDLPRLDVNLNLKRGEQCHFKIEATHLERRTVTRAIAYAGPTASIRIAKGVRFRLGAIAPTRISQEVLAPLDDGVLYITNRRLLFDGSKQSRTFELSKIINFTPYRDGLNIERDRGKDQIFRFEREVELAAMILGVVLAQA